MLVYDFGIDVQRHTRTRVPHPPADGYDVYSLSNQETAIHLSEIMSLELQAQ